MLPASRLGIAAGQVVAGRYEVLGSLGAGGMATVWKAHDRALDVEVALKVLKASPSGDPVLAERFRSEVKLAWRVRHRNVCGIHEYGEDGDLLFISMELVEGKDLRRLLGERSLSWEEALDVAIQIAEGLEAIHQAGVIHRDLKPANITLDGRGLVRLMDFGIARVWGEDSGAGGTSAGHVVGSPEYMSPEQVRGANLDFRSDVYALGLVAYELFTGTKSFRGASPADVMLKRLGEDPDWEGPAAQRIPRAVLPILKKALARETSERYQKCADILADLRSARGTLERQETDPLLSVRRSDAKTGGEPLLPVPARVFSWDAQARILIPPLIRATHHADREVRMGAVEALSRLGSEGVAGEAVRRLAADGLRAAQADQEERIRQAAAAALARLPRHSPPPTATIRRPTDTSAGPEPPPTRPRRLATALVLVPLVAIVVVFVWRLIVAATRVPERLTPAPMATTPAPPSPLAAAEQAPTSFTSITSGLMGPLTTAAPRVSATAPAAAASVVPPSTALPPEPASTPEPLPGEAAAETFATPSAVPPPLIETPTTTPPAAEAPIVQPECLRCPIPQAAVVLRQRLGLPRAVRLRVHVSSAGDVIQVDYIAGPPSLRDAITQAARGWRYRPALRRAVPVPAIVEVSIEL